MPTMGLANAVGYKCPLGFQAALWMADALAELDVYWLEEPLHRYDYFGWPTCGVAQNCALLAVRATAISASCANI